MNEEIIMNNEVVAENVAPAAVPDVKEVATNESVGGMIFKGGMLLGGITVVGMVVSTVTMAILTKAAKAVEAKLKKKVEKMKEKKEKKEETEEK